MPPKGKRQQSPASAAAEKALQPKAKRLKPAVSVAAADKPASKLKSAVGVAAADKPASKLKSAVSVASAGKPASKVSAGKAVDASKAVALLVGSLQDQEWKAALAAEFEKPYFVAMAQFLAAERQATVVHPPAELVFSAFNEAPFSKVKVVIIGQDPYHEPGQAHGMCFSVLPGVKPPPSLKNIYKELADDIGGFRAPEHGYLMQWAKQGVLLLNATLTVREGHKEANSHSKSGWQTFTDEVIRALNEKTDNIVFLLWGGFAQKKGKLVDTSRHRVIETGHPSPLSVRHWRGSKSFSKCNSELKKLGHEEIDWSLSQLSIPKMFFPSPIL
ncbi:unnamed protein product [Polarella glacialis]|uniref:Uracil-DNA glycosylase n=1 Tax=Polarella glacialis TaxID=89957 RepID=A0A813JTZ0_POLGL|nr:unnamed protein product [Polarella glacialis]